MAKIVPQGNVVNMGFSDPMDRLNQVLETVSRFQNLAANQQVARAKRETTQVNSLGLINGLIDKANDGEDLEYAENVLNSLDTNYFSNPDTEILYDLTNKNLTDAKGSFESITNSGNEIANLMTSNFSVFDKDTDAPMAEKKLADMNANEIVGYFNQISGNEGALGSITKLKNRINAFEQQYSTLFGINDKGIPTKKPNIKFKDANGNDIDPTEFGILFNNYKNRINMFIEAGFRDKILNFQEAEAIVGGDIPAYNALKERKDQEFKFLAQQGVTTLRGIDSKIATLAKEDDEQYGMTLQSMFAGDTKMVDEYFNHIASINPGNVFEITSDPEQNAANASAHALRSTKEENLAWFNQYREAHAKNWLKHKEQAVSWGFGYFGMDEATPANLFGEPKAKSDAKKAKEDRLAKKVELSEFDEDGDGLSDFIDIDSSPSEKEYNAIIMKKNSKEREKLEKQLNYQNSQLQNLTFDENTDNPKTAGARGYNKKQIKFINFSLGKGLSLDPIKYSDPKFQEFLKDYKQYNQHKSDFEDVKKALVGGSPAKWLSEKLGRTPGGKSKKNKLLKATYQARKRQMEVFKKRWNTEAHNTIAAMEWLLNSSETLNNINLIEEKINKLK